MTSERSIIQNSQHMPACVIQQLPPYCAAQHSMNVLFTVPRSNCCCCHPLSIPDKNDICCTKQKRQDRQCMYKHILRCIYVTIVVVERQ
jgi:hypothetical protein